jgi:hypothetical protein
MLLLKPQKMHMEKQEKDMTIKTPFVSYLKSNYLKIIFLVVLGLELMALHLLGRHSNS